MNETIFDLCSISATAPPPPPYTCTPARNRNSHSSLPLNNRHHSYRKPLSTTDITVRIFGSWPTVSINGCLLLLLPSYCYYCTCVRRRCTWRRLCPHSFSIGNILYTHLYIVYSTIGTTSTQLWQLLFGFYRRTRNC